MKIAYSKEKTIKVSLILVSILLIFLLIFLLYKTDILQTVRKEMNNSKKEEMGTKAQYQIMKTNGQEYEILIIIENQRGIERITKEDIIVNGKGKTKIVLDKKMKEGEEYKIKIKAVGEPEEEYVLIATSKIPIITIENMDTTGDGTTKTVKIEYPNNEKFNNYYSLDDGMTWQEYNETIDVLEVDNKTINAKVEVKEGKTIQNIEEVQAIIVSDSLISAVGKAVMGNDRHYRIGIKDEIYTVHTYIENGDTIFTTNKTYGNANDVGTVNTNAKNMVIVKVNGDLTINNGVTLTSYGTNYGGPKGMLLYVTGNLENKGTITMTARGAKAEGQNVYLWKNNDLTQAEEYEFVPKVGASGGVAVTVSTWRTYKNGTTGTAGTARRTGGGGAGGVSRDDNPDTSLLSGRGGNGTSYSGGSGGGAARNGSKGGQGSDIGGAGGNASMPSNYGSGSGGGAGNPGGINSVGRYRANPGSAGTGGLLILYGNTIENKGTISSNGMKGGAGEAAGGGSSGGGSINIFYNDTITKGTISAMGGSASGIIGLYHSWAANGGIGGNGCISTGSIATGTYISN